MLNKMTFGQVQKSNSSTLFSDDTFANVLSSTIRAIFSISDALKVAF